MTSPEERIRELARKNAIAPEAAERLLAAVRPDPLPGANASFDPFRRVTGGQAALLGVVACGIGLAMSRLGVRFDGALDVHLTHEDVPLAAAGLEQLLTYPVTAAIAWAVARAFSRAVRPVDVLGAVGLARLPLFVLSIPLALVERGQPADASPSALGWVALAIGVVGWGLSVYVLLLGFRTATGLRAGRLAGAFIGALFAAETVTKILGHFLLH
jgi:hypothetical protein